MKVVASVGILNKFFPTWFISGFGLSVGCLEVDRGEEEGE